jgi:hypothetical protein
MLQSGFGNHAIRLHGVPLVAVYTFGEKAFGQPQPYRFLPSWRFSTLSSPVEPV